jgi:hypothetical protein
MKTEACFFAIAFCLLSSLAVPAQTLTDETWQTRSLKNFTAISLNVPAEVELTFGDYAFAVAASAGYAEKLKTDVKNGELIIRYDHSSPKSAEEKMRIRISLPTIQSLEINGSGRIQISQSVTAEKFSAEINGSGSILFAELNVQELMAEIAGSGKITGENGSARLATITITGSGQVTAENFRGNDVNCTISGSGKIRIGAAASLNAVITGSGEVMYAGNPEKKNVAVTGSGSVTAMK